MQLLVTSGFGSAWVGYKQRLWCSGWNGGFCRAFENYVGPLPAVQAYCNLQMSQRVLLLVGGQLVLPRRVPCNASGHQNTQFEKLCITPTWTYLLANYMWILGNMHTRYSIQIETWEIPLLFSAAVLLIVLHMVWIPFDGCLAFVPPTLNHPKLLE